MILARIGQGAHITVEMERITPGVWMPKNMTIDGTARVLLVHNKKLNEQLTFTGYHLGPAKPAGVSVAQVR